VFEGLAEQAITGLTLLEKETGDGWLVNDKFSQADIMTAICYQGGALLVLPDHVNAKNFPRLAAFTE
jgi:glutathione S-transferase